ncbi:NAD(P)-binding protein [Pyrenochaeta sp. DS3sAY3a]|nr:NAD(P)-binding protein [Pyrenochaeta sp. DS3sAY3a]
MSSNLITIIAGVGSGTGASIARKFAATYPVILLARKPDSYEALEREINDSGGKAVGISADVSDSASIKNAVDAIKKEFGDDVGAAAAIFNASSGFVRKPFLELSEDVFSKAIDVTAKGGFHFSQATLPLLLKGVAQKSAHPPSLIFTGATASVTSNAQVAAFSTGKWAVRALSQSLAKEFGPQGVHVAHAIIDGLIDIPKSKDFLKELGDPAALSPDSIANDYWWLHTQPATNLTWEVDFRPATEKW